MLSSGHPQPHQLGLSQDHWDKARGCSQGCKVFWECIFASPNRWLSELDRTLIHLLTEGETEARSRQGLAPGHDSLLLQENLALGLTSWKQCASDHWGPRRGRGPSEAPEASGVVMRLQKELKELRARSLRDAL